MRLIMGVNMREIKFRCWYEESEHIEYDIQNSISGCLSDHTNLMQYTGLKDKNGVEIYEGDILDWGEFDAECEGERAVIEWNDKNAGWMMQCYTIYGGEGYSMLEYLYPDPEVIGNIYENPELLER